MSQPQRLLSTLPAIVVAATGVLLVAGCSSSGTAPSTQPSINFGSQASITPGMPGGSTASASVARW